MAGQVVAQLPASGTSADSAAHLAVSAGSTMLAAGPPPGIWDVLYIPERLHFHLHDPWAVSAGGRWLSVSSVGVSLDPLYRGLLFLAEKEGPHGPLWPDFTTAISTDGAVTPPTRPSAQPSTAPPAAHSGGFSP